MPDPQNVTPIHRGRPQGIGQPAKGGFSWFTLLIGLAGGATAYHFITGALRKDDKPSASDRVRAFAASQGIGPMPMVTPPMMMPAPKGTMIAVGQSYTAAAAPAAEPEFDYDVEE